jgi:hypothetical protein
VLFPIIGLDFLRFFGMQVNPSSSEDLLPALSQCNQEVGTNGGRNAAHVCGLPKRQVPAPACAHDGAGAAVLTYPCESHGAAACLGSHHLHVHGH